MSKRPFAAIVTDAPAPRAPSYVVAHGTFVVLLDGARREIAPGTLVPDAVSAADIAAGLASGILAEV